MKMFLRIFGIAIIACILHAMLVLTEQSLVVLFTSGFMSTLTIMDATFAYMSWLRQKRNKDNLLEKQKQLQEIGRSGEIEKMREQSLKSRSFEFDYKTQSKVDEKN